MTQTTSTPMAGGASGRLRGKSAIVTGARRSIGRAIAAALAGEGAGIVVHYRTGRDEAEVTLAALRAGGADAIGFGGDLSDSAVVTALFDRRASTSGGGHRGGERRRDGAAVAGGCGV